MAVQDRPPTQDIGSRVRPRPAFRLATVLALVSGLVLAGAGLSACDPAASVSRPAPAGQPDFGPNVHVFRPSMPASSIAATVNRIARQQAGDQFGPNRYALLFEPGTYGSAVHPLFLQVGYYTSVAGLGVSPGDVVINGAVDSFNQCSQPADAGDCTALNNFWRSLSNLTINFPAPPSGAPGRRTAEFWAASQASPVRRVEFRGLTSLEDYCSKPGYSSGGFIADSKFSGRAVISGTQQQFLVRNSTLDGPYTTLATSPVTAEAPVPRVDSTGSYSAFVPAVRRYSAVVLGLGFPTLVPDNGTAGMRVASVPGVRLAGMIFDAGPPGCHQPRGRQLPGDPGRHLGLAG